MRTVTLIYQEEPGYGWYSSSPDFHLLSGDPSFEEARKLAREAAAFCFEVDESEIEFVERIEERTA